MQGGELTLDKYGVGQDCYCYPGSDILRNRYGIQDVLKLEALERDLSGAAASEIEFKLPPYDLACLKRLHRHLFQDLYGWAGEIRTVDISKGDTRFCNVARIEPEANKIFATLADRNWLEGLERDALVESVAEYYGDLNIVHPFREGNGRAQRLLFEHIIINAGFEINWWPVDPEKWRQANIDSVVCDYERMAAIFEKCIGSQIVG